MFLTVLRWKDISRLHKELQIDKKKLDKSIKTGGWSLNCITMKGLNVKGSQVTDGGKEQVGSWGEGGRPLFEVVLQPEWI